MTTARLSVTVPELVLKEIDKRRGDVKRSTFVSRVLEKEFFNPTDKRQHRLPE